MALWEDKDEAETILDEIVDWITTEQIALPDPDGTLVGPGRVVDRRYLSSSMGESIVFCAEIEQYDLNGEISQNGQWDLECFATSDQGTEETAAVDSCPTKKMHGQADGIVDLLIQLDDAFGECLLNRGGQETALSDQTPQSEPFDVNEFLSGLGFQG